MPYATHGRQYQHSDIPLVRSMEHRVGTPELCSAIRPPPQHLPAVTRVGVRLLRLRAGTERGGAAARMLSWCRRKSRACRADPVGHKAKSGEVRMGLGGADATSSLC